MGERQAAVTETNVATKLLFDLDGYEVPPAAPPTYVLFYVHDGTEYLARRVLPDKDESPSWEWLPAEQMGRKLPKRFTRFGDATRVANILNQNRTADGEAAGVVVQVRMWHG